MKKFIFRNWHILALAAVIVVAGFLHFWNFNDWVLFRADQSRDAYYAKAAIDDGPIRLRTLGPKFNMAYIEGDKNKRGDTVHLGPYYYYVQYLSAAVFGSQQPWVFAFPDAALFILSIPLFYYFLRHFFSKTVSLSTASLYAFSYFNLLYSRFAWSCNQLFFWQILFALGLYKMTSEEKMKIGKWTVLTAITILALSQIHFVALTIYLIFGAVYLLYYRFRPQNVSLKHWLAVLILTMVFYAPVIASEAKNNWDNSKRLWAALRQEDQAQMSFQKKVKVTFEKTSQFFTFVLTSYDDKEIENIELYGGIFFFISILTAAVVFFKLMKDKTETDSRKKLHFIVFVWSGVSLLIFFKIAGKLDNMRYYIAVSPLALVVFAMWLSLMKKMLGRAGGAIFALSIALILIWFNISATFVFFQSLASGSEPGGELRNPKFESYDELVTFEHMKVAHEYMAGIARKESGRICYRNSNYQYNLGFEYVNDLQAPDLAIGRFGEDEDSLACSYFYIGKKKKGEKDIDGDFLKRFRIIKRKDVGALTVWRMGFKENIRAEIEASGKKEVAEKEEAVDDDPRAFTWAEVFGK